MPNDDIVELIDAQIAQLQQARAVLADIKSAPQEASKRRGRPKGSGKKTAVVNTPAPKKFAKRTMTAEGKARIAAAQKARWAAARKAEEPVQRAAKKTASKPKPAKKKAVPAKKSTPPELQVTTETTPVDA